jgi:hypothetical protein
VNGLGVEILVYIYLAVCLAMILFNIGTIIFAKQRDRLNEKRRDMYERMIEDEIGKIRKDEQIDRSSIAFFRRKLRHPEHLLVFVQVMTQEYARSPEEIRIFLDRLSAVLGSLTTNYERHNDPIRYAFFLYSIKTFGEMSGVTPPDVAAILLRALRVPNTYCRENALQAIYCTGRTDLVIRALQVLDSEHIAHNKKLISDGLLSFRGSKDELMDRLWDVFETFDVSMQTVILDFIRFCAPGHRERLLDILKDENRSPELRFSCIRYFAKYPDPDAYPVLKEMAYDFGNRRWEFPAIACTALASYPGDETVETLKRALHVANWYVRYNAAESLARLGVGYMDLIEVIDGNDRYAREILQFQLDMQYNQRKKAAAQ